MTWKIHHKAETVSTNLDAREGVHGDVFTADYQTAGRGRLDHKWLSPPGANLMMSAVLDVGGLSPESLTTLPLVVGLAVAQAVGRFLGSVPNGQGCGERSPRTPPAEGVDKPLLKWPNDVLVGGKKISGILCERHGDCVIAGIGVNVKQRKFAPEIAKRATSLESLGSVPRQRDGEGSPRTPPMDAGGVSVVAVRDAVLERLGALCEVWRSEGFAAVYPAIQAIDCLRGQTLSVRQVDDDKEPIRGVCGGIQPDGSLRVGETDVYAGEAHVESEGLRL